MAYIPPGMRDWLLQRSTAVVMALYLTMLAVLIAVNRPIVHGVWQALFSPQWMKAATALFLFSLFIHAWLGIKNVLSDYIKSRSLRLGILALVVVALLGYAVWTVEILWN